MSKQHNKKRYGELWPDEVVQAGLRELEPLKDFVILSGGWAWHFMSPVGHPEFKHAHDHKDIDIFVLPMNVGIVVTLLKSQGFKKARTKYDRLPSKEDFRRYEKHVEGQRKIVIDFFVRDVLRRQIQGYWVIEPVSLLKLYGDIHSSDKCFAVRAATRLLAQGIDPVGRPELCEII